ncbi:MAG: hypothetical protein RSB71_00850 [Bacilli bacterium]
MPSRMEKYYQASNDTKRRTNKNADLYKTIYDEAKYTNVEGISIIEKNEKIDIEKIRELLAERDVSKKEKIIKQEPIEVVIPDVEEKNYDIMDVLDKAKNERPEADKKFSNTQYDILKGLNLDNVSPTHIDDADLKNMIDAITVNSKMGVTSDLLDDLKTIHEPLPGIDKPLEVDNCDKIDKSFYTSSMGFSNADFDDFKEMKDDIKKNSMLTKILLFILLVVVITGAMFLIYHFVK